MKEKEKIIKNIKLAFILNFVFAIIEFIGGLFTNSISILSDSIHDFGDALAIAISLYLENKSTEKPNNKYTYGYLRYSVIGAFITSLILLLATIIVIKESFERSLLPESINYTGMIWIALFGLIVNGVSVLKTSKNHNINEKAINLHLLEDLLSWICVLVGSIVMKFTGIDCLDSIMSIGISVFILYNVYKNIIEVFYILTEKKPQDICLQDIQDTLKEKNKEILDIHHIHCWTLDGNINYMTLHLVVKNEMNRVLALANRRKK